MAKAPKDPHYLKNKELLAEILHSKAQGALTRAAERMLQILAQRTIKKFHYRCQSDRDDCLQSGLLALFTTWKSFDPSKSTNAFAYYTEIFKRGAAKGFTQLFDLKGDKDKQVKMLSLSGDNDGEGMFSI